jgi:hypothetical protein
MPYLEAIDQSKVYFAMAESRVICTTSSEQRRFVIPDPTDKLYFEEMTLCIPTLTD